MEQILCKGNEAIVKGALLAGCQAYFGYPITPASEIAEKSAELYPKLGRTFLQAESEVAAINMVYGAAGTGIRCMTASSSPGVSLKLEGLSYIAGAELPCVIVNVQRGGPGLGNIGPEQSDYFQMTKGGGHGHYRVLTLAPNSAQEMCDLTMLAFDLAEKYRNPVAILTDGYSGQMIESVSFPDPVEVTYDPSEWAVDGTAKTQGQANLISSIYLNFDELEAHTNKLQAKYEKMEENEVRFEEYKLEDAELVVMGYGIVSRILKTVVDKARKEGLKVGLLRPISLFPFPIKKVEEYAGKAEVKQFLVVELSKGQMVEDVRLAVEGRKPVAFHGRMGGNTPTEDELMAKIKELL